MNRNAASSLSAPLRPAVARPIPLSKVCRSYLENAESRSSLEANQRYSVGLDTPAWIATSDRLSLRLPLRPRTSAVAARIRSCVEVSTSMVGVCSIPQLYKNSPKCHAVFVSLVADHQILAGAQRIAAD